MPQLDAIFSSERKLDHPTDITTWGQLGLRNKLQNKPIQAYGRNSASGTYGFFRKKALGKGPFKKTIREQPSGPVLPVPEDGIAYTGIGYAIPACKMLKLQPTGSKQYYAPTQENILSGRYPLARCLYIAVSRPIGGKIAPETQENDSLFPFSVPYHFSRCANNLVS